MAGTLIGSGSGMPRIFRRAFATHPAHLLPDGAAGLDVANGFGKPDHYMLEIDPGGGVVVEPGPDSEVIYIGRDSADATTFTFTEIETAESLTPGTVTSSWIVTDPLALGYGKSTAKALDASHAIGVWNQLNSTTPDAGHWLLWERGGTYALNPTAKNGLSALHPALIGAYGTGAKPLFTDRLNTNTGASNFVFQGIAVDVPTATSKYNVRMTDTGGKENIMLSGVSLEGGEVTIEVNTSFEPRLKRFTLFETSLMDSNRDAPVNATDWTNPNADRSSGIFTSGLDGILIYRGFADKNGWEVGYDPDLAYPPGQPGSQYSHNYYLQDNNTDVTFREVVSMRGAASSIQNRSGATMVDVVNIDNNQGFQMNAGLAAGGNYNQLIDVLLTSAGYRETNGTNFEGAVSWGISDGPQDFDNVASRVVVAHGANPNDAAEIAAKTGRNDDAVNVNIDWHLSGYRVWNWIDEADVDVGGLTPATLDLTTVQRYTDDAKSQSYGTNSIADLAAYLRSESAPWDHARLILDYFQGPFGHTYSIRATAQTGTFRPWAEGDGFRWDNRNNWISLTRPGDVSGDTADLAGYSVHTYETADLATLDLGTSGDLHVWGGKTSCTTLAGSGTITTYNAGQVFASGTGAGLKQITLEGGRFANDGTISDFLSVTVKANSECLLALPSGAFTVAAGRTLDIQGDAASVGFDGTGGGSASLTLAGTLNFVAGATGFSTIREFRSGMNGRVAPNVASTVTLNSGSTVTVDGTGLAPGTYDLIDVDTLTDNGASLPAGVAVSGNKLQLTVT